MAKVPKDWRRLNREFIFKKGEKKPRIYRLFHPNFNFGKDRKTTNLFASRR